MLHLRHTQVPEIQILNHAADAGISRRLARTIIASILILDLHAGVCVLRVSIWDGYRYAIEKIA